MKLARRAGVNGLSNNCVDYITSLVYTRLSEVVDSAKIVRDEREAKVLTDADVMNALRLLGETIIY